MPYIYNVDKHGYVDDTFPPGSGRTWGSSEESEANLDIFRRKRDLDFPGAMSNSPPRRRIRLPPISNDVPFEVANIVDSSEALPTSDLAAHEEETLPLEESADSSSGGHAQGDAVDELNVVQPNDDNTTPRISMFEVLSHYDFFVTDPPTTAGDATGTPSNAQFLPGPVPELPTPPQVIPPQQTAPPATPNNAPPAKRRKVSPQMSWDKEHKMKYVLHVLCESEGLTLANRAKIFNDLYANEIREGGYEAAYAYSSMAKMNMEKGRDRNGKGIPQHWQDLVGPARDQKEVDKRDGLLGDIAAAKKRLGI